MRSDFTYTEAKTNFLPWILLCPFQRLQSNFKENLNASKPSEHPLNEGGGGELGQLSDLDQRQNSKEFTSYVVQ